MTDIEQPFVGVVVTGVLPDGTPLGGVIDGGALRLDRDDVTTCVRRGRCRGVGVRGVHDRGVAAVSAIVVHLVRVVSSGVVRAACGHEWSGGAVRTGAVWGECSVWAGDVSCHDCLRSMRIAPTSTVTTHPSLADACPVPGCTSSTVNQSQPCRVCPA
jgi:hypothetical protein